MGPQARSTGASKRERKKKACKRKSCEHLFLLERRASRRRRALAPRSWVPSRWRVALWYPRGCAERGGRWPSRKAAPSRAPGCLPAGCCALRAQRRRAALRTRAGRRGPALFVPCARRLWRPTCVRRGRGGWCPGGAQSLHSSPAWQTGVARSRALGRTRRGLSLTVLVRRCWRETSVAHRGPRERLPGRGCRAKGGEADVCLCRRCVGCTRRHAACGAGGRCRRRRGTWQRRRRGGREAALALAAEPLSAPCGGGS